MGKPTELPLPLSDLSDMDAMGADAGTARRSSSPRDRAALCHRWREPGNELADELGMTRERVRQIQLAALRRLRQALAIEHVGRDAVL
jgi:hypothetical protein